MKKTIPAFAILLSLFSALILTQCTPKQPEKRPETKEEMLADIEKNYIKKEESETLTIYSKEINGIETDDYYSVHKDDGKIVKSPWTITEKEAAELKKILNEHPEYLERKIEIPQALAEEGEWIFSKIKSEKIFISKLSGEPIPLKQVYAEYLSPDSEFPRVESYYFNLLDGSISDYSLEKVKEAWEAQK